jgi:hypothetical protein
VFRIDGHIIGWHAAVSKPLHRLASEVVLADRAFDDSSHAQPRGMASEIRGRTTEYAGIFEEIPKDFPESHYQLLGG